MGNPYLSSDESLILSTHDILIDGVSLDLMLTSRRLILIDNSVTPFHIRTIPLENIITAVSGIDANGDPIITLSHMDFSGIGAPQPMDFIFIRQKGKQRATECNEWAATLSNHAAEARNDALAAGTLPYDPVKVIQPRMSATYRIEMFSPRKPIKEKYPMTSEPASPPQDFITGADENRLISGVHEVKSPSPEIIPETNKKPEIPVAEEPVSMGPEITLEFDANLTITVAEEPVSPKPEIALESDENPIVTVAEEPVSPEPEIALEADENPIVTVAEEPVSPEPEITVEADENPIVTVAEEPVSPEPEIALESDENPIVTVAEEPVSPEPEITVEADENPIITVAEEPVSPEPEITVESEINPTIKVAEEPVSQSQEFAINSEKKPESPVSEESLTSLPETPPADDENPENTDAAQAWADAVRTVTTPLPVILPITATESITAGEIIGNEPKTGADQIHFPVEETVAEFNNHDISGGAIIPEFPADEKPVALPLPETTPVPAASSSPIQKIQKSRSPLILFAAIIVIILVVLGIAVISSFTHPGSGDPSPSVVVPNVTNQPAPDQLQTQVPTEGAWVRIEYPGTFIGEAGNPGFMHPVSGSGIQIYKILWRDRIIQASAQKQDYSGDTLTLEVYNDGILIKRSSTRTPMGSVSVLIDPITGEPAGSG